MGTRALSFLLRTLTAACVLGAIIFTGAYTQEALCLEMLLTPACMLLAYAANGAERALRAHRRRLRAAARRAAAQVFLIKSRRAS